MPRSLGKYPFPVAAKRYLGALEGHRAEITIGQLRRDLQTIGEDVKGLRDLGSLSTSNPYKMSPQDVAVLIGHWRTRPRRGKGARSGTLDPTSQRHLYQALKGLLGFCGNGAAEQLKTMPHVQVPQTLDKPIRTLSETDLARLRLAADGMAGWWGAVARFIVGFLPQTGLRPKEIRLQEVACVDTGGRLVLVCHPKGEGKYATPHAEYAPIGEQAIVVLQDFLSERAGFLNGDYHDALIPFRHADGRLDYWPEAMLRKLKKRLEAASGVQFQVRTFRARFGQVAKDGGASIEAVSQAMRHHGGTAVTERYYARLRPDRALDEVRKALSAAAVRRG